MAKQYKGIVKNQDDPNNGAIYTGTPSGYDNYTQRIILSLSDKGIAFIPGSTFVIKDDPKKVEVEKDPRQNCVFSINAVLVDEICADSGCVDQNGDAIFDKDIVEVDGKHYGIYYSTQRLAWELTEVEKAEDGTWLPKQQEGQSAPFMLYRLAKKLAGKATICPGERLPI